MSTRSEVDEMLNLSLGNREIEQRIDQVGDTLIHGACPAVDEDQTRPRFISAAELVRRVQPFLGMN